MRDGLYRTRYISYVSSLIWSQVRTMCALLYLHDGVSERIHIPNILRVYTIHLQW